MVTDLRDTNQPAIGAGYPMTETGTSQAGGDGGFKSHNSQLIRGKTGITNNFLHYVFVDNDTGVGDWRIMYMKSNGASPPIWNVPVEIRTDSDTQGSTTLENSKPIIVESTLGTLYIFWLERHGTANRVDCRWKYSPDNGDSWSGVQTIILQIKTYSISDNDLLRFSIAAESGGGGSIILMTPNRDNIINVNHVIGWFILDSSQDILKMFDLGIKQECKINSYKVSIPSTSNQSYFAITNGLTGNRYVVLYDGTEFSDPDGNQSLKQVNRNTLPAMVISESYLNWGGMTVYGEENWKNVNVAIINNLTSEKLLEVRKFNENTKLFTLQMGAKTGYKNWKEFDTGTNLWSDATATMTVLRTPTFIYDQKSDIKDEGGVAQKEVLWLCGVDDVSGVDLPILWETDDGGSTWYRHEIGLKSVDTTTERHDIAFVKRNDIDPDTNGRIIEWIEGRGNSNPVDLFYGTIKMDFPNAPTQIKIEDIITDDREGDTISGIKDTTPEFKWTYHSPPAVNMDKFQIQVSTVNTFASTVYDSTLDNSQTGLADGSESTEVSCGTTLTVDTTYYLRIRTEDTNGIVGAWTTFEIKFIVSAKPTPAFLVHNADDPSEKRSGRIKVEIEDVAVFTWDNNSTEKSMTHFKIEFGDGIKTYNHEDGSEWVRVTTDYGGNITINVEHTYGDIRTPNGYIVICQVKNNQYISDTQNIEIIVLPKRPVANLNTFPNPTQVNKEVTLSGINSYAIGVDIDLWEFFYTSAYYATEPDTSNLTKIFSGKRHFAKVSFKDTGYQYIYHRVRGGNRWSVLVNKSLEIENLEIKDLHGEGMPYGNSYQINAKSRTAVISIPDRVGDKVQFYGRESDRLNYSGIFNNANLREPSGGKFWMDRLKGIHDYQYLINIKNDDLGINFTGKVVSIAFQPLEGTTEPTTTSPGTGGWKWSINCVEYNG